MDEATQQGIPASQLKDDDLRRELRRLHETRHETFLHGTEEALSNHTERMAEMEEEYLRRHPQRSVEPGRTREGTRRNQ